MRAASTKHQACPKCGDPAIETKVEMSCNFNKVHEHMPPDCPDSCEDCNHLVFHEWPGTFSHMQSRSLGRSTVEHQTVHQCKCGKMFVYFSIVTPKGGYR
jgi:hypothetical protein